MSSILLAPHNDDETLFASFLCLRHRPHVIVCLKSVRMGEPSYPGKMPVAAKTREFETDMAMKAFDCTWEQWPISDAVPDWHDLNLRLSEFLSYPDLEHVIVPMWESSGNGQHNQVSEIAEAVFGIERLIRYTTYNRETGRSRWGTEVEYEPEWISLKLHALACYKSQAMHPATRTHFIDGGLREWIA